MNMNPYHSAIFWIVFQDGSVKKIVDVCFKDIHWTGKPMSKIRYILPLKAESKDDVCHPSRLIDMPVKSAKTFIGFLRTILKHDLGWKTNFVKVNKLPHVLFTLDVSKLNKKDGGKGLMYLTAFRYLHEYKEIVKLFAEESVKAEFDTPEKRFALFQQIHIDAETKKGKYAKVPTYNMCGHGLIYTGGGYGGSSSIPISMLKFADNLKAIKSSVQRYFE